MGVKEKPGLRENAKERENIAKRGFSPPPRSTAWVALAQACGSRAVQLCVHGLYLSKPHIHEGSEEKLMEYIMEALISS